MRLKTVFTPVPLVSALLFGVHSDALAGAPVRLSSQEGASPAAPAEGKAVAATESPAVPPSPEVAALYRDRLARAFAQRARSMLQREFVFIGMLESGQAMMEQAVTLAPDNPFIWRVALDFGVTMEDGDAEAAALVRRALARLTQLEPEDEVIRLRRLLALVEQKQTVEERSATLTALLTPSSIAKIGPSVAARLAFDFALLLRRAGDQEGFERELLRSIDLDPFFPEAAEFAAGYFRVRAPTAADEAAGLRSALLANPMREPAAMGLAELCMRAGAYRAAADILNVEAELLETSFPDLDFDVILSDLCLSFWGSGQTSSAAAVARKRQEALNSTFRRNVERTGSTLKVEDLRNLAYPMSLTLASTFAAFTHAVVPEQTPAALKAAVVSAETTLRAMDEQKADPTETAKVMLESAFLQLWLGGDVEQAKKWLDAAAALVPLSEAARARFDGFLALRAGDAAKAVELFTPIAETDVAAALGLALAEEATNNPKSAAKRYLTIAKAEPASALGIWSRDRLRSLVGQPVVILESAEDVERAAALPLDFLNLMRGDVSKILLSIEPKITDISPWDPMVFNVQVTNRSDWPLPITPEGPLFDTATVTATVNVPGEKQTQPPFALLPLNRRFSLAPGATMSIPIDVSLTDASFAMRDDALSGAFVSIHPIVNWRTTERGLEPGPLGIEAESPLVHVRGQKVDRAWIADTIAALNDSSKVPDPARIVALASVMVRASKEATRYTEEERALLKDAPKALVAATKRLWPEARAWLVFGLPKGQLREIRAAGSQTPPAATGDSTATAGGQATAAPQVSIVGVESISAVPELEELDALLQSDEDSRVRMAWIAVRVKRPEDPVLQATAAHADPVLAKFAKDSFAWMSDVAEERRKKLNLTQ